MKLDSKQANVLFDLINGVGLFNEEKSGALAHALLDIKEASDKIYEEILPRILELEKMDKETFIDFYTDVQEELHHIDYHIHDAFINQEKK